MTHTLTPGLASKFASLALSHVTREFPNKLDHIIADASQVKSPRALHPLFFGSFDWHSCVHGYWLLARVYRRFPTVPDAPRIRELFDAQMTERNVASELAYLEQPSTGTFERPYGWAWLLMLAGELTRHESAEGRRWSAALKPLGDAFVQRFHAFLPNATYPIRGGAHFNTAFAMTLAFDYADTVGDAKLRALLGDKAAAWYGTDADCQAWEPGGDDFLSPALIEAECMRRAKTPADFALWFDRFLPRLAAGEPRTLFMPVTVSDRTDGKIGHLDGVNLTRAWCWRSIARALPDGDPRRVAAFDTANLHIDASLPHIAGDYLGEHWLATFAMLALEAAE